jgi:hypothetical protein
MVGGIRSSESWESAGEQQSSELVLYCFLWIDKNQSAAAFLPDLYITIRILHHQIDIQKMEW